MADNSCRWIPAIGNTGYIPRIGWDCWTHDSHSEQTDEPSEPCDRATCLVCQAQRECAQHTTMYASYQGNSATYLAGLLVDEEAKRNQLEQLLVKHLAGLESKDPQTKADAIREITLFVRTYIYAPDPDPETEKRAFDDIIAKAKKRQS